MPHCCPLRAHPKALNPKPPRRESSIGVAEQWTTDRADEERAMSTTAAPSVVEEVDQWLSRFGDALTRGDAAAAAELFAEESFWRDLVAFTWNIKTVEGRAGVPTCSSARSATPGRGAGTPPRNHCRRRSDRGVDRVRDRGGAGVGPSALTRRPGVDAADRARGAQGHEEERGIAPPQGRRARCGPGAADLARGSAAAKRRSSATRPSRTW